MKEVDRLMGLVLAFSEAEDGREEEQAEATLRAELEALVMDVERYRWLRDLKCCTFSLRLNDDHAVNYTTAQDWIDNCAPDWFEHDPPDEVQRMRDTNTIWTLQVYPNTPVGFNVWNAATLDAAIDAAREVK